MERKPRTELTLKEKIDILDKINSGVKQTDLSVEYNVTKFVISRIKSKEADLRAVTYEKTNSSKKRQRKPENKKTEEALLKWFKQVRSQNVPISGPILLEKACQLSNQLGENFMPISSWIDRFKVRNNFHFEKIHSEKNSADEKSASDWLKSVFPKIAAEYDEENIYNADETGLFFRALPTGTLTERGGQQSFGTKSSKERLTILIIVNQTGSDKQMLVIGKYGNPRCFKNKNVPVPYFFNKKAWMTSEIWQQISIIFDRKMKTMKKRQCFFATMHHATNSQN